MFNFLKAFFNDEKTIVGLCAFEMERPSQARINEALFNDFQFNKTFEPKYEKNVFLIR